MALTCIFLGWMVTAFLGGDASVDDQPLSYDPAAVGVFTDPSGVGSYGARPQSQPGIIVENDTALGPFDDVLDKKPSVSGALADLQSAVKDKIQQWNPYFVKPHHRTNHSMSASTKGSNTSSSSVAGELVTDGISEEDRLGARVRIGKCTILFNGNAFWERAIRTHERHNREHGYRLHVLRQHLMDDVWSKPAYILSLVLRELAKPESERLEWLFWVDADTIILNPYIPIEIFLPPQDFDDIHLMYSNDWNGLNNGVFPIRVNQWSAMLLASIVAFRHYRPDDPLTFRDQSAMNTLMKESRFVKNTVESPQRWFNAYQGEHNETLAPFQIRRGDFLVHFAGVPNRDERMAYWLDRAEQRLDDWEIPLKSTSYGQEVRDFWNERRHARAQYKETIAETRLTATQLVDKIGYQMDEYGDRLSEETKMKVDAAKDELRAVLGNEQLSQEQSRLEASIKKVEAVAEPLKTAISESHKLLLTAAHEAIFAGEKDLMDGGWNKGLKTPELEQLSNMVQQLREIVMLPQENWNKQTLITATNAVTVTRAAVAGQNAAKLEEANALAAIQNQILAELEQEAAGAGDLGSERSSLAVSSTVDSPLTAPTMAPTTSM